MPGFDDGSSPSLGFGSNDLQVALDSNTAAVNALTSAYQGANMGGGMTRAPSFAAGAEGQTFTSGTFPKMTSATFSGRTPGWAQTAERLGNNTPGGTAPSVPAIAPDAGPPPTLNQMASGGGANGGGANFGGAPAGASPAPQAASTGSSGGTGGGAGSPPTIGSMAAGGGANGGGPSFSTAAGVLGGLGGVAAGVAKVGNANLSNMLLYNAVGGQAQNQYGISAQAYQNQVFGSGANLGIINGMSPQDMAQAASTYLQMGSGQMGSTQFQQGVNTGNLATAAVQGMSAAQAAQFAQQFYSPGTSLGSMMMGLPSPLALGSGNARSLASWSAAAFPRLGIQAGPTKGTFNKTQLNALANPWSTQNLNLQNAGYSESTIQDIAAVQSAANNAALSKAGRASGMTDQSVEALMQQAVSGGTKSSQDQAWSKLQSMGLDRTTVQKLQSLNKQQTANQQAESGGYNSALSQSVQYLSDISSTLGKVFSDVHAIASALGAVQGAATGVSMGKSMLTNSLGGSLLGGLSLGVGAKLGGSLLSKLIPGLGGEGSLFGGMSVGGAAGLTGLSAVGAGAGGALFQHIGDELNALIGGKIGSATGMSNHTPGWLKTGLGAVASGLSAIPGLGETGSFIKGIFGGGAASVSTTQPQTRQGSKPGSSISAVPSQAITAVRDAEQQVGKPYVYGGDTPSTGFDCSGLVMWAYDQAGINLPRTSQQQWAFLKNKSVSLNQVREGDIIFAAGSDGTAASPGHEALMISSNQLIEAPYTGADIRIRSYNPGEWQHAARPVGALGGRSTSGSGASTSVNQQNAGAVPASSLMAGNAGAAISGNGGDSTLGLTTNADSSLFGGGGGGTALPMGSIASAANGSSGSGSTLAGGAPGSTATAGNAIQNGRTIYNYLLSNLFGGSKIAAAGAIASIYGESGWNPEAIQSGGGGGGLIQWTPYQKYGIPITGNATSDLDRQLPLIIDFVKSSGDMGTINAMKKAKSVAQAAQLWDQGVERAGIDDVHSAGISLATQIAGLATGGTIIAGERGPEAITIPNGSSASVMTAAQTTSLLRGTTAQPAQGPYTASPTASLLLDLSPANYANAGAARGGNINFAQGAFNVTIGGATNGQFSGTLNGGSDINTMRQQFQKAVEDAISQSGLLQAIRTGDVGSM